MSAFNSDKNLFYSLTPDHVLAAVEACGLATTGEYVQLNSYENRVFDVVLEKELSPPELGGRVIAKFYRPGRWSKEAILEEHQFLKELTDQGIPAVNALALGPEKKTLHFINGLNTALFPKARGRLAQELSLDELKSVGRLLARLHNVGATRKASHRPVLNTHQYGWPSLKLLQDWVAPELWARYEAAATQILKYLDKELKESGFIRIHGDCHKGNLLKTDRAGELQEFFFIDFDDFCNGPPVQDFWMFFSADEDENLEEQEAILAGYLEFRDLDLSELRYMRPLRGLRIIHYAAWIARRWEDPSFPRLFPQFQSYSYWAEDVEALEKIAWAL